MLFLKLAGGINQKRCFGFALLILNGCMRCMVLGSTNNSDNFNTNAHNPLPDVVTSIRTPLVDSSIPKSDWGTRQRKSEDELPIRIGSEHLPADETTQQFPGGGSEERTPSERLSTDNDPVAGEETTGHSGDPGPTSTQPTSTSDARDQFARRLNFKRAKISTTTTTTESVPISQDETTSNRVSDHFESEVAAHVDDFGEVLQLDRPPVDNTASTTSPLLAKRVIPGERSSTTQKIEIPHSVDDGQIGHQSESSFDIEYAHHQDGTESYWEPSRMPPLTTEPPPTTTTMPPSIGTSSRPRFRTSLRRTNTSSVRTTSAGPIIVEVNSQLGDGGPIEAHHIHQSDLSLPVDTANNSSVGGGSDNVIGNRGLFAPLAIPEDNGPANQTEVVNNPLVKSAQPETNTINFRDDVNVNWPGTRASDTTQTSGAVRESALDNVLDPSGSFTEIPHMGATNVTEDAPIQSTVDDTQSMQTQLHDLYRPTPVPRPMINLSGDTIHLYTITSLETSMQSIVGVTTSTTSEPVDTITVSTPATEDFSGVLEVPEMVQNRTSPVRETTIETTHQFMGTEPSVSNNNGSWRSMESSTSTLNSHNETGLENTESIKIVKNSELMASYVTEYTPPLDSRIFHFVPSSSKIRASTEMAFNVISPSLTTFSVTQTGAETNFTELPPAGNENQQHGVVVNVTKVQKNETLTTRATETELTPIVSLKPITWEEKPDIATTPVVPTSLSDKSDKNVSTDSNANISLLQTSSPTVPLLNLSSSTLLPSQSYFPEVVEMETASPTMEGTTDYSEDLLSSMLFDDSINETGLIATVKMENSLETVTLAQPDTNNVVMTESGLISSTLVISPASSTAIGDGNTKHDNLPKDKISESPMDTKHDYTLPTIKIPLEYLLITMKCSWAKFCERREELQKNFSSHLSQGMNLKIFYSQIVFFNINACNHISIQNENDVNHNYPASINVSMYVSEKDGSYSAALTEQLGDLISKSPHRVHGSNSTLHELVVAVHFHGKGSPVLGQSPPEENDMGIIAAITISSIAATCLVLLCILLIVLKRRQGAQQQRTRRCRPVTDAYSLDSISIYSSFCKRKLRASKRSYLNQGFDDPQSPTNKINFAGLANFCLDETALNEEYKQIPMTMAKLGELPQGTEIKNRYANVIPFPETRVLLTAKPDDPCSDYINANYVRGFRGASKSYIACQAPLEHTVVDFWQMVWENQCKVIIMLTNMEEDGVSKCATYFAESDTIDSHRLFGDYQVTTKKKDKRDTYVVNYIQLKNLEKNLMREVIHFWYTAWPTHSTPQDHVSVAEMLVEARPSIKNNQGPTIVHCSTGTGRTGAVIAINICIQEFETSRTVDIPKVVYRLRQDRGGLVQTPEQYIFIYQVLNEFASKIMNHSERSSLRSSR